MTKYPKFRACAVHAAPVFLDAQSTVEMACGLIAEAARAGAQLIAFPESFVPGFPVWASVQAPIKNHEYFKCLAANSIEVPGPEVTQLCAAARESQIGCRSVSASARRFRSAVYGIRICLRAPMVRCSTTTAN